MSLNIRLYGINSENDFIVSYKSGDTLNSETTGFTIYDTYEASTTGLTISGVTLFSNTKYWIKIQDVLSNRYIIENIYTHDDCYYDCYDTTPTPTPTETPTPTPTLTPTSTSLITSTPTPTPTPTTTSLVTSTPTPTPTITCNKIQNLIVSGGQFLGEGSVTIQLLLENNVDVNTSFEIYISTTNYGNFYRTVTINNGTNYISVTDSLPSFGIPIILSYCVNIVNGSSLINCNNFECDDISCPCSELA